VHFLNKSTEIENVVKEYPLNLYKILFNLLKPSGFFTYHQV